MATIKDVEDAMGKTGSPVIEDINNGFDNSTFQEIGNEYVIFKLKGNNKKGVYIDGQDDVINPKTGKTERIRLLTGVATIWLSEQTNIDKEYVRNNKRSLEFRGRICRLNKLDTAAIDFARVCNSNINVKTRIRVPRFEFFEYDPIKQAEDTLKMEMLELEMAMAAKDMDSLMMKKYASFIGIQLINELGQVKPETAIRQELMLYAKKNPSSFQSLIKSIKEVEIHWQIKSAIVENLIDISREPGSAHWGSGGLISKIPSNKNPIKYLTDLAMTNTEDGRNFLNNLQTLSK